MKILTILGTRPEIIRLSRIIPQLDRLAQHVLVHTGQNYAACLNDIFFTELGVRRPDHCWDIREHTPGAQVGRIIAETERVLTKERPDKVLILGDTNSGLAAIVAKRMGIPVYHMEAGNRCYDDRVPEEVNRRIIDHCTSVWMPYTVRSKENLVREGVARERIFVIGNPIWEVLQHYAPQIAERSILQQLHLQPKEYFLVTVHRAEGVDSEANLRALFTALQQIHEQYRQPVICSLHPRTRQKAEQFGIAWKDLGVTFLEPMGFFDFVRCEQQARCVLSDSGTVQEECCVLHVPNVTLREVTERPETIECGSNILTGFDPEAIRRAVTIALEMGTTWQPPAEYVEATVSRQVSKLLLGYDMQGAADR